MFYKKYISRFCVWLLLVSLIFPLFSFQAKAQESGFVDPLESLSLMHSRSSNIVIDNSNGANFGGDTRRATRNSTSSGFFMYKTDYDMHSFTVPSYFWTGTPVVDLKFFVSGDGVTFHQVTPGVYPSGKPVSSWQQFVYEAFNLPAGIRYLKIQLEGDEKYWTPQVSRVIVNMNTASVEASIPSESILDGPRHLTLSTITPGAEIYYKKNAETGFQLYQGPIEISSRTAIEAYARKNGLENSIMKAFNYFWKDDLVIDRFGQVIKADFPEKVETEQELQEDVDRDREYYDSLSVPEDLDAYGGLSGSGQQYGLNATGYFSVQSIGGRTVMVSPEGNVFFSLGVNAISSHATYTKVSGREGIFEWLPPYNEEYATAFLGKDNFSHYIANLIRKTGQPHDEALLFAEGKNRVQKWGFNTAGAWSGGYPTEHQMPHVKMLPISNMNWAKVDGIHYFDIFADGAEQKIDQAFAASTLPVFKDDPSLIGYFMDNEIHFHRISTVIPAAKASKVASKRKLVDLLKETYHSDIAAFNAAWNVSFGHFDELYEAELKVNTTQALDDVYAFIELYADTLYSTFERVFRKHDPNHLLLGDRFLITAVRNERLKNIMAEAAGKYFDIVSFNYYAKNMDPTLLRDIHQRAGNKPLMITEFNYGTANQGLNSGVVPTLNEEERQLRYRNYVEMAASLGFVVGTHWFSYVDQPAMGRHWEGYTGERYNTGLINVADHPYKEFLQGIKITHDDIYSVILGQREPFRHEFSDTGGRGNNKTMDIPYTPSTIHIDGMLDDLYDPENKAVLTAVDRIVGIGGDSMQGEYHFVWDETNLYLHAKVQDPTPMLNVYRNSNVWRGDAIELFVGPEEPGIREGLLAKDRQLILSADAQDDSYYWRWYNTSEQSAVQMTVIPDPGGDGYLVEAAIPWHALNLEPEVGKPFLFDFGFDDSEDGVTRKRQWMWNGDNGNSGNRGYWGKAILAGSPDRTPPVITISGVSDGQSYTDQATPVVSVADAESGLKEAKVQLDGADWESGTPVEAKGPHVLVVTAVDNAGNTATETIHFTIYHSTTLEVQSAAGQYSDEVVLQAELKDKSGEPVAGGEIGFQVGGILVGTVQTNDQGKVEWSYKIDLGVTDGGDSSDYEIRVFYAQNDAVFHKASEGGGSLNVTREDATVAYAGSQMVDVKDGVTLAAHIIQDLDGSYGALEGLPVQFALYEVNPDGTVSPYSETVTQSVYMTDANGQVTVHADLPAGYYEIRTILAANDNYTSTETVSYVAVYDPEAGSIEVNGFFNLADVPSFMGENAKKVHLNLAAGYEAGSPYENRIRVHAEPQGKDLTISTVDWMVIAPGKAYVQGTAFSGGETYTVRVMLEASAGNGQTDNKISVVIWNGNNTSAEPAFQVFGAGLNGSYQTMQR